MEKSWSVLYKEAKKRLKVQNISPFIETGNISCAILTDKDNIYYGVNITSNTSINSSAEKSAVTMMLNNGEKVIKKIVILNELEELIIPTEECVEYILELCDLDDAELLINIDTKETLTIKDIIPDWWGTYRNKKI